MKTFLLLFTFSFGCYAQVAVSGSTTLSATQLQGLITGTPTAVATYTTDTAINLCSQSQRLSTAILFVIVNNGSATITMAGGVGVATAGTMTIAAGSSRLFILTTGNCSNSAALSFHLQSLGSLSL
jgi:hypothetical protein